MSELRTGVRVRAEGLGITAKTLVTFLVLLYDTRSNASGKLALLAFAGGQLAYGTFVLGTYVTYYGTQKMWPTKPPRTKYEFHNFNWTSNDTIYTLGTSLDISLTRHS
jgi:oligosaccharide translocation protein RFT1